MPDDFEPDSENDAVLLRRFHRHGDEEAFAALVRRWLPLMAGCARRVCGNESVARDAVQSVFCVLARKAGGLVSSSVPLGGWLHRAVTLECRNLLRREHSRERAVRRFVSENPSSNMNPPAEDRWDEVLPHLDGAIEALPASDRELIIQRFFERRSWQEIGAHRGRSPDAARMALGAALEKLARLLRARGVTAGAAALATGLGALASPGPASAADVAGVVRTALPFRTAGSGFAAGSWLAAAAGFVIAAPVMWLAVRSPASAQAAGPAAPTVTNSQGSGARQLSTGDQAFDLAGLLAGLRGLAPSGNDPEQVAKLRALLIDLPAFAVPEVLAALKTRTWHTETRLVSEAFFSRWAELDPAAAFEALKDPRLAGTATTALTAILQTPGLPADVAVRCAARLHGSATLETQKTFEAILASSDWQSLAGSLTNPEERRRFTLAVLSFADFKEPRTVKLLMPLALADRQLRSSFAATWATADEPAALAWLATFPRATLQYHEPALAIANVVVARDPVLATRLIQGVPFSERNQFPVTGVWVAWLKKDRPAAEAALAAAGLTSKAREIILKSLK